MLTGTRRTILAGALAASGALPAIRRAAAAQFLTILTGGASGVFYPLGIALARLCDQRLPGIRANAQATKASVENLTLLSRAKAELAFATGESVLAAWEGNEEAGFAEPLRKLRGLASIYTNYIHVMALADSGIRALQDLRGKVLSVGAPRSGNELTSRAILKGAGLSYEDLARVEYLPYGKRWSL
jgi:TRAP transporter TAXI family solute receptor